MAEWSNAADSKSVVPIGYRGFESLSLRHSFLRLADSKVLVLAEFALIAAAYVADWAGYIVPSKIPYLLVLAWISLRLRGVRWRDLGFARYRSWTRTLVLGIAAGAAIEGLELFVTQPLIAALTGSMPDLSAVDRVAGSVRWLAVSLAFTWTLFAFGEELFFRGYLMTRIAVMAGGSRAAWALALTAASLIFGLSHFPQGITGVAENFIDGLILGALYLKLGRNLAVPIVAHGVTDTVDFLLIFFHRYPGMQ